MSRSPLGPCGDSNSSRRGQSFNLAESLCRQRILSPKLKRPQLAGVSRQTIHTLDRLLACVQVDAKGRILRQPFEAAYGASHHHRPLTGSDCRASRAPSGSFILIEVLGAEYVRALGNVAGRSLEGEDAGVLS